MRLRPYLCAGIVLFAPAALAACGLSPQGALTPTGYESNHPTYRVVKNGSQFLDDAWMLDNYYTGEFGKLHPKVDGIYKTSFAVDPDGAGKFDAKLDAVTYDLRFEHKKHAAFIWLRSVPTADDLRDKDLRVLMRDYVEEIAGAGYEAVQLTGAPKVVEKRYAAEIVAQGEAKLASKDAYYAVIDVANIDQIKLTPSTRHVRVELVFARPGTDYVARPQSRGTMAFPALLVAGYANFPEDFAADEAAFRTLLADIEIGGQRGFTVAEANAPPTAPSASASAAPAPPAAPPAPTR
jgi:hypothetical protein